MSDGASEVPARQEPVHIQPPQVAGPKPPEMVSAFSGPIPPPSILAGYESACPGAADRIITMAEEEAAHRRTMEAAIVEAEKSNRECEYGESRRGQLCALTITLVSIIAGAYLALNGHDWAGGAIGVGGVGSIVTTFIVGRNSQAKVSETPAQPQPTIKRNGPKKR